jgi:YD repeat-containing protein
MLGDPIFELKAFRYDAQGNVREVQTADGQRSRWLYDGWGRVHKATDAWGNVQWRAYDLLSRVTTVHEPDGNVRRFSYEALGHVTRAQDRHHDVQYAYRGLGRLIRRVEAGTAVEFLHDTEERLRAVVNALSWMPRGM